MRDVRLRQAAALIERFLKETQRTMRGKRLLVTEKVVVRLILWRLGVVN
jgi:hypothetical protein